MKLTDVINLQIPDSQIWWIFCCPAGPSDCLVTQMYQYWTWNQLNGLRQGYVFSTRSVSPPQSHSCCPMQQVWGPAPCWGMPRAAHTVQLACSCIVALWLMTWDNCLRTQTWRHCNHLPVTTNEKRTASQHCGSRAVGEVLKSTVQTYYNQQNALRRTYN